MLYVWWDDLYVHSLQVQWRDWGIITQRVVFVWKFRVIHLDWSILLYFMHKTFTQVYSTLVSYHKVPNLFDTSNHPLSGLVHSKHNLHLGISISWVDEILCVENKVGNRNVSNNTNMSSRDLIGFSKEEVRTRTMRNLVSIGNNNHKTKSVKWKDEIWKAENLSWESLQIYFVKSIRLILVVI